MHCIKKCVKINWDSLIFMEHWDIKLERLSNYFVAVSQEFPPLELDQLSEKTRQKLLDIREEDIPQVQEHEIFLILDRCKKKKSSVPGDMPPRLFYGASAALAAPAARIINNIARTGEWPRQYKTEWVLPVQKTKPAYILSWCSGWQH